MKICLVSNYSPPLDEGMKNVAYYLSAELEKCNELLHLSLRNLFSANFWQQAGSFHPDIIHYIPGPSIMSLVIARALKLRCRGARTVMSATQPRIPGSLRFLLPILKPDLMLTQSPEIEEVVSKAGYKTEFLPNGVDTARFVPVSPETKRMLREKYGLNKEKFVILHIGPVRKRRNLRLLAEIQQKNRDCQVLIAGNTDSPLERDIYRDLMISGCLVWRRYFEEVEEIYALSDCYVFPASARLSGVDLPLSVMEAMSCNLPVISTVFGALGRLFVEGDGLFFAETEEDFFKKLDILKAGIKIGTREKALPYSWEQIAVQLQDTYKQLL